MIKHGAWWAVLAGRERLELGVHVEPRSRRTNEGVRFGPYLDAHLPFVTVSVGRNPVHAGAIDLLSPTSRGGIG